MKVLIRKQIFDSFSQIEVEKNKLSHMLEQAGFPKEIWDYVEVRFNGEIIYSNFWEFAVPKDDVTVAMTIVPQGGDSAGEILKTVAVLAVSYYTAGALTGGFATKLTFGSSLLVAGATATTGLLINSMFPPPNQEIEQQNRKSLNSVTGQSNQADPYGPVIRNYGFNRIYPRLVVEPFVRYVGDDQYFSCIYDFGIGRQKIAGSSIRIGESLLSEYKDVQQYVVNSPDDLVLYTDQVNEESFQVLFEDVGDNAIRVSDGSIDRAVLKFEFPFGLYHRSGKRNIRNSSTVKLNIKCREAGTTSWTDISVYDVKISRQYQTSFKDVAPIILYPDTVTIVKSYTKKQYGFTLSYITELRGQHSSNIIEAAITDRPPRIGDSIEIPGESYDALGGATSFRPQRVAKIRITDVEYLGSNRYKLTLIEPFLHDETIYADSDNPITTSDYRVNSNLITYNDTIDIEENNLSPFRFTVDIGFYRNATWEFWVYFQELDHNTFSIVNTEVNDFYWTGITGYSKGAPINTDVTHTYIEIDIRATDQLNGKIDNLSADCFSFLEYYDPTTQTWKVKPTSNPAWVFVDILTGEMNQRAISKDKIDTDSIVAWAEYCESERITFQGNEIGFECNFVLDYEVTIRELLNQVCSVGRASLNIVNGKFGVVIDERKTTPVQIFNQRNVKSMNIERGYQKTPDAMACSFVDPGSNWQKNEVIAYDDGKDSSNAELVENIDIFGCTSIAQAWRQGRYFLAQHKLRRNNISISVDFENLACSRGDLVLFSHDVLKQGGLPTRVLSISGNNVTLDEPVSDQGGSYVLRSRIRSTDTIDDLVVTAFTGTHTVTVDDILGLQVDDLVVFGESSTVTREYIVKSIEFDSEYDANLLLIEHAPEIYDADSGTIPDYEVVTQSDPLAGGVYPGIVTDLAITYTIDCHPTEKRYIYNANIVWNAPAGEQVELYEVYVSVNSQQRLVGFTSNNEFDYQFNVLKLEDTHEFKVIAVDGAGRKMPLQSAASIEYTPTGDTQRPANISEFNANVLTETIELDWRQVQDCDLDRYYIRYSPNLESASWAQSVKLTSAGPTQTSVQVPLRTGTYFIKARDWAGNYSETAAFLKTQVPEILNIDFVSNVVAPTWSGVNEETELLSNSLKLLSTDGDVTFNSDFGNFYFSDIFDLGDVFTARLTSSIIAQGYTGTSLMSNWPTLASIDPIAGVFTDDDYDAATYARVRNDVDTMINWTPLASVDYLSFGSELTATPWSRFTAADFTGRIFQLKVQLEGNEDQTVSPLVSSVNITANWTDRTEEGRDVTSGTVVSFDNAFVNVPALQVTAQENIANGDYYIITDKTSEGFTVQFYDSNDNPVNDRKYDWIAKGFGKKYTLEDINF